jgi:hypothetical protein
VGNAEATVLTSCEGSTDSDLHDNLDLEGRNDLHKNLDLDLVHSVCAEFDDEKESSRSVLRGAMGEAGVDISEPQSVTMGQVRAAHFDCRH